MELALSHCENAAAETKAATDAQIRFFHVPHCSSESPKTSCEGVWQVCSPDTAGACFGVSYYFAAFVRRNHDIPIGLINAAWSGACAETWIPLESLRDHPRLNVCVTEWERYKADYARLLNEVRQANEAGGNGRPPKSPTGPEMSVGMLYNGMLHPVIPYGIKGVCWYQGENNVLNATRYRTLFPFLIREWRRLWRAEPAAMPFLFVQIANFGDLQERPQDNLWTRLRDAQRAGLGEPHTAMVTAIDIGGDFHPKNKKDVGKRLALAARANVYGEKSLVWCGPVLRSAEFTDTAAILTFDHVGSGLEFRDRRPQGFALAGRDRKFAWADATIEGNRITVTPSTPVRPQAVRYAWSTNPLGNLRNREGLPAYPFRTDDWEAASAEEQSWASAL
jgi:sialate O-acetylesterase